MQITFIKPYVDQATLLAASKLNFHYFSESVHLRSMIEPSRFHSIELIVQSKVWITNWNREPIDLKIAEFN